MERRVAWGLGLLAAATGAAHGQGTTTPVRRPPMAPGQPVRPAPGGLLPPRPGASDPKTPDEPPKKDPYVYLDSADRLHGEGDVAVLEGHVVVRYQGYTGRADRAEVNRATGVLTFEGGVEFETGQMTVRARKIVFNGRTYDFVADDATTVVPPEVVGPGILLPVHLAGKRIRRDGEILTIERGFLTTCDFDLPHGQLGFGRATLFPKKRLILRDATFYRYESPLVRIGHLSIPISEQRRYSYAPTVGRTNEEGFFVKAVVGYALARALPGLLKIDLMEKKGVGLGFDQVYAGTGYAGRMNLYTLKDRSRGTNNLNVRVEHEQRFGEIDARLTTDLSNNSYQAAVANSRSRNTNLSLTRGGQGGTTLALGRTDSNTGFAKSDATNWTLSQGFGLMAGGRGTVRFVRSENRTESGSGTSAVTVTSLRETGDLNLSAPLGLFRVELQANRNLSNRQSGGTGQSLFFAGTERLPELRLSLQNPSPSVRRYVNSLTLGYGRFLETALVGGQATPLSTDRLLLDLGLPSVDRGLGGGLKLRANGRFQQTLYDGGFAAQYLLDQNTTLSRPVGERGEWSLQYRYLRPYGGTPVGFRMDQSGSSNSVTAAYSVQSTRFQFSLGTAYDIERAQTPLFPGLPRQPWSNLVAGIGLQPSDRWLMRLQSAYDPNTGRLLSVGQTVQVRGGHDFALDTGANYDPTQHKFSQITARLLTDFLGHDTRLGAQASYSGYTKRFDYRNLALTHSFHDYELTFAFVDQPYGFRSEKGFNIGIRLKALPAPQSGGGGRFGASTDNGLGGGFRYGGGFGSGFSTGSGLGGSSF